MDPALCPEDEDKCEAGNGVLGNEVSPYCRTREVIKSSQVPLGGESGDKFFFGKPAAGT